MAAASVIGAVGVVFGGVGSDRRVERRSAALRAGGATGFYRVRDVILLPRPVQRPRVPVWIGGFWPHRAPMRRAARWDGAVRLFLSAGHGHPPPVDEVRDLVAYVDAHRDDARGRPFEVVLGGASPANAAGARDLLGPLVEAGATWWDERRRHDDEIERLEPVLRRIEIGPPTMYGCSAAPPGRRPGPPSARVSPTRSAAPSPP